MSRPSDKLTADLLRSLGKPGVLWLMWVAMLCIMIAAGLWAWWMQMYRGLGLTGLGMPVYWGFPITNFVFWIGISHAGTLISAILRLVQAEWRRPITRCAEIITVFALLIGGLFRSFTSADHGCSFGSHHTRRRDSSGRTTARR